MEILSHFLASLTLVSGAIVLPLLYYIFWLCFLDPLRHIPGPLYTRISSIWHAIQCRFGRKSFAVHKLHQRYGDVVRISARHVSINSPDALQEIYTHDRIYLKGPWYEPLINKAPPLISIIDADEHHEQRKNLTAAFSLRALRDFEPHMSENHLRFARHLNRLFDGHSEVRTDLNTWINLLAFDIISDFSFGKPFGFQEKGYDFLDLVPAMDARLKSSNAVGNLPKRLRPLVLRSPDRFWRAGFEQIVRLRQLVLSSYNERVESGNMERKDLMSYMLNAKSEGGESLGKERILAHATAMIVAGSDSTAASTVHFVDKISRDMGVQHNVQAEIDKVFPGPADDDWIPLHADTEQLTYTKAVLYEVLRLCPTAAIGFERVTTHPSTMFAGYELPPGTLVSVPTYSVHRNAEVYPDPDNFDPKRWLQKDSTRQYQLFNIFSTGPRSCIGQNFAWMEMLKTITILLKKYRIERMRTEPTELFDGFFIKAKECNVRLTKRF